MRWLTGLGLVIGLAALVSYSQGAHIALRYFAPAGGAWWNRHEFWLMEGSATLLGLLAGIRFTARLVDDSRLARRAAAGALITALLLLLPLTRLCANVARLGWGVASAREWFVARAGYESGIRLDRFFMAGAYFLKTAGFATLVGLALMAAALVAVMLTERTPADTGESSS